VSLVRPSRSDHQREESVDHMRASDFRDVIEKSLPFYSVKMGAEHAGRRGSAAGADLENLITVTNKSYEMMKLGIVKKNQVRKMMSNGHLVNLEKSTVDYDGFLADVGFVGFDAKSCNGDSWRPDRRMIHQFMYLLTGQRTMPKSQARFFYLIELRDVDDSSGSLRKTTNWFVAEDLERILDDGKYIARAEDEVFASPGLLIDYRKKLIETA
jgi:hypothetical protein